MFDFTSFYIKIDVTQNNILVEHLQACGVRRWTAPRRFAWRRRLTPYPSMRPSALRPAWRTVSPIETVVVTPLPERGQYGLTVKGQIAALVNQDGDHTVVVGAGACADQNLRGSQFEMVAGARNRFNLRTESRLIRFVKLVPRDERRGLFRAAA
ncbi:hypothetical protein ACFPIF_14245 [Brevundimonas faecalis]|uniref:hypothetical protein n=1 Tax=Brevundimonas faecalis TaxID=947378 RepID=UPI003617ABA5